ncbi:hydroxypyruvate isomerase family protein [Aquabacterium sp. A7-Y]|uniref:2-oxo-tetronate isomerase n=1 Tax=Aquabacterium sp. A7-Y TaxID=1349605 RepID=UPI00223D50F7|nr:2-oxo-tetronate isomerase [Aquabacterium sp. A7-Y]MCW7538840.1 hydroxypyruvate isomerase family protein [Aquabacterium sp. A7-Y]
MPRFAANLSLLYTELPFLDRFAAAARDGFKGVEFLFPYEHDLAETAARRRDAGLQQVLFNAPPGDWTRGERGLACLPGRQDEFRRGIVQALECAEALSCPLIHVMAGRVPAGVESAELHDTYVDNLAWAAAQAGACGRRLSIEPINPRDMPGYLLTRQDQAHQVLAQVGSPHLAVQMDLYHCQIVEGDLATKLRHYLPGGRVAHLQIAGVPERHEPDVGELNYAYLFELIDSLGYPGWVGCEYRPRLGAVPDGTRLGLGWRPPG